MIRVHITRGTWRALSEKAVQVTADDTIELRVRTPKELAEAIADHVEGFGYSIYSVDIHAQKRES